MECGEGKEMRSERGERRLLAWLCFPLPDPFSFSSLFIIPSCFVLFPFLLYLFCSFSLSGGSDVAVGGPGQAPHRCRMAWDGRERNEEESTAHLRPTKPTAVLGECVDNNHWRRSRLLVTICRLTQRN
jgi:hypothetical protein